MLLLLLLLEMLLLLLSGLIGLLAPYWRRKATVALVNVA